MRPSRQLLLHNRVDGYDTYHELVGLKSGLTHLDFEEIAVTDT